MGRRLRERIERLELVDNCELTWWGLTEACRRDDDRIANRYLVDPNWHTLIVSAVGYDPVESDESSKE